MLNLSYSIKIFLKIIIIYFLFSTASLITLNPHFDEKYFHLPTVKSFYENSFIDVINNSTYKSSNTPLPYIIGAVVHKVIGIQPSLFSIRLLNIFFSASSLIFFYLLLKPTSIYPMLILFFYPYFLKPSFAYFISIYGLFFFLSSLLFLYWVGNWSKLISGLLLSFAVLSQQFYLIIYLTLILYFLILKSNAAENLHFNKYLDLKFQISHRQIFLFSFSILIPLILFINWGGLTHPDFRVWRLKPNLINITSISIILGGMLFPYVLINIKQIDKKVFFICSILSLLLILFAAPVWTNTPQEGGIRGLTFHALALIGKQIPLMEFLLNVVLSTTGLLSLLLIIQSGLIGKSFFIPLMILIFIAGFALTNLLSERHLLPLIVLSYIYIFKTQIDKLFLKFWFAIQTSIGLIYFYYIMFIYNYK